VFTAEELTTRFDFSIPEAQRLSDLTGVRSDLEAVGRICQRVQTSASNFGFEPGVNAVAFIEERMLVADLVCAGIVRIMRTHGTGARAGIPAEWVDALPRDLVEAHSYFKKLRDKFIAHSVSPLEDNQVFAWVTAARVRDLSVDMEIDASMITWIGTCNCPWRVPLTLRTRLKEFFIGMPNAEQALMVARSVVDRALSDAGVAGFRRPGRDVIVALAPLSAREIYQVVIAAVATALKDKQRFIGIEHLPPELVADGSEMEGGNASRTRLH
jgi:hypothetical protein